MRNLGLGFAYLLIYTTPIQIGILIWQLAIILTTEYTLLGMSTKDFLIDNLKFLHDWIYSWFWNELLDFFYQFPAIIMIALKGVVNFFLGSWLINKLKGSKA